MRTEQTPNTQRKKQISTLKDVTSRNTFAALVEDNLRRQEHQNSEDVNEMQSVLKAACTSAAESLPNFEAIPHKPWITIETLNLIDERTAARHNKDDEAERELTNLIKKSVKKDKKEWPESLACTGKWDDIKFLRDKKKLNKIKIKNKDRIEIVHFIGGG